MPNFFRIFICCLFYLSLQNDAFCQDSFYYLGFLGNLSIYPAGPDDRLRISAVAEEQSFSAARCKRAYADSDSLYAGTFDFELSSGKSFGFSFGYFFNDSFLFEFEYSFREHSKRIKSSVPSHLMSNPTSDFKISNNALMANLGHMFFSDKSRLALFFSVGGGAAMNKLDGNGFISVSSGSESLQSNSVTSADFNVLEKMHFIANGKVGISFFALNNMIATLAYRYTSIFRSSPENTHYIVSDVKSKQFGYIEEDIDTPVIKEANFVKNGLYVEGISYVDHAFEISLRLPLST